MRSGYTEDCDEIWPWIKYRGQVASAIRGKRGQAFMRELLHALDSLPQPRLIADELEYNGEVCAIGAVGRMRGIDMTNIDLENADYLAHLFGVAHQLIREIEHENDEVSPSRFTPEERFSRVRKWVVSNLNETGEKL